VKTRLKRLSFLQPTILRSKSLNRTEVRDADASKHIKRGPRRKGVRIFRHTGDFRDKLPFALVTPTDCPLEKKFEGALPVVAAKMLQLLPELRLIEVPPSLTLEVSIGCAHIRPQTATAVKIATRKRIDLNRGR